MENGIYVLPTDTPTEKRTGGSAAGRRLGGIRRSQKMTKRERSESARTAVKARWARYYANKTKEQEAVA